MSEDRNKCPPGYEVWDFYDGKGDGYTPPDPTHEAWLAAAVGLEPAEEGDEWNREQAIAAAWAHRDRIVAEAVREERAKIVKWLRRDAARYGILRSLDATYFAGNATRIADAIERGEHEGGGDRG